MSSDTTTSNASTSALLLINDLINQCAAQAREFERQRTDVRYPLGAVLRVGRPGNGETFTPMCDVYCLDVSHQGVGMIAQQELMPGRFLRLDMSPLTREPCVVELQVMACKPMMSSLYRIGASFCF
ncbi:MAG: PilZ domain-containing protein [Phycisphaeraceae bacterium]